MGSLEFHQISPRYPLDISEVTLDVNGVISNAACLLDITRGEHYISQESLSVTSLIQDAIEGTLNEATISLDVTMVLGLH